LLNLFKKSKIKALRTKGALPYIFCVRIAEFAAILVFCVRIAELEAILVFCCEISQKKKRFLEERGGWKIFPK
jgi:hypothetical protein